MNRIAVPYENGNVFQHFGRAERFQMFDIANGEVAVATTINTNGRGHGALADILKKCGIDTLICGGIGDGAKRALDEAGITFYGGVKGKTDKAVDDLLKQDLIYDMLVECDHSSEQHHGVCGKHGHDGVHPC